MECVGKKKVKKMEEREKAHKDNDSKSPDSAIWCLLLSIFQLGYKLKKKKRKKNLQADSVSHHPHL